MKNIKYLKLLAVLLAMNGVLCTSVAHASDDEDDGWEYQSTDYYDDTSDFDFFPINTDSYGRALSDEIRISGWHGNTGTCTTPSTITLQRWDVYDNVECGMEFRRNGSKTFRVVGVADGAFKGRTSLTSVSMPSVTSIGAIAFSGCTSLTSVSMPNVTSIGGSAFDGCTSLTSVSMPNVTSIGGGAFGGCTTLTSVSMPNVTSIGGQAFSGCTSLTSVSMPNVTSIGGSAFSGCTSLTSVSMPNVTSITGWQAFSGCSSLKSVTLEDGIASIPYQTFYNCTSLESVNIPSSVMEIDAWAFYGCGSIKEVYVPQCAMERGLSSVFPSDYSTIQHLVMDGTVSSIAANAFYECKSLTNIEVDAANAHYFVSPLDGCLYDREQTTLLCCPRNVTDILIPHGVTKIGNYAFAYCSNLVSVTMPVTLKEIGENAFLDCVNLPTVALPDSVTKLCSGAFRNCRKLHGVTIPSGVRALDTTAFDGCDILWTEWYRALADFAVNGRAYDLTRQPGDRAIADVTVDGDMALDAFVLKNGKVYDSVLYIQNIADHSVRVTLPTMPLTGYKTFKGVSPLTLPAYSTSILTITRVAGGNAGGNEFLVTREELETVQ